MRSSSPYVVPTWLLVASGFLAAVVALSVPLPSKPNAEGFRECLKLHPERFCRIDNGYPVPVLAKAP